MCQHQPWHWTVCLSNNLCNSIYKTRGNSPNTSWHCRYSDNLSGTATDWHLCLSFSRVKNILSHSAAKIFAARVSPTGPLCFCWHSLYSPQVSCLQSSREKRRYYTRMQLSQVEWNVTKYKHFSPQNYYLYTICTSSRLSVMFYFHYITT